MAMINISPFAAQERFIDPEQMSKRYYGYISGVGAGKTYAGIVRTIHNMMDWNVGQMGAIIAPTRQMIVNVIIPEMRDIGLFDPPINWEYKSAYSDQPGIHTPDGGRALILSADNTKTVERLRGLNLAWVWIDERTAVPSRAQEIAMQRLRIGEYRNLYVTTTPKGKDDVYDFFVGDVDTNEQELEHGTLYEADDRLAVVGVPTSANPHTPDDYKDAMAADMPEEIRQQEVEGKFVEIGAGIFTLDMMTYIHTTEMDESWRMNYILGVDPASKADEQQARETDSDYWAISLIGVRPTTGEIYVIDQKRKRGMTLREGISWISNTASQVPAPELIIESNQSQRWLQQELASEGLNTTPVQSTRDKEDKLIDLSIPLENDRIIFVNHNRNSTKENPDDRWGDLRDEMLAFPSGSHDDCLDSLYLAVDNAQAGTQAFTGDMYGIRE
ncbi:terminase [Haloquadratum phage sp.]|nr:terminase [Haloquadratum phage sp.]